MIFSAFKNQYDLAADDKSSIRTLYPATNFGTIQGRVMGGNSVPVFGAIVHAISAREGNVIASSISDDDGSFSITGLSLEDDNYYLYIKPPENINALPQYYSSVQTNFCPGSYRGSFFSSCNSEEKGFPQKISFLSTDSIIDLGNLTIKCDLRLNPSYLESKNAGGNANLTLLESTDNLSTNGGLSFIGYFYSNQVSSDKNNSLYDELLIDLRGETLTTGSDLKISLLGFSLGVKADYYVSVDKIDQFNITTNIQTDINNQQNLFIDLDADPNNNRFKLTIKPQSISLSNMKNYIPEPSVFSDSEYFYHLLLELVDDVNHDNFLSIVDSSIQDNSSCLEAPFTYAVDANTTVLKSDEKLSLLSATCGTIGPNDSDFSGPFNMMIGFLTIFLISHLRRWRKIV